LSILDKARPDVRPVAAGRVSSVFSRREVDMEDFDDDYSGEERRSMPRYPSRANARVVRETDAMRVGISGRLTDVSVSGIGVRVEAKIDVGEDVQLDLSNPTQRFSKTVRGVVRYSNSTEEGTFQIGVQLRSRLTPPEVQMLRSNRPDDPNEDKPTWV
jgi:hypothetical protein